MGVARLSNFLRVLTFSLVFAFAMSLAPRASAMSLIRDAEIEAVLRGYWEPILRAAGLDPRESELILVQDPSINAFVTDGRRMFIHTGLITTVQTPSELKGVMAHETGHMAGGHAARMREAQSRAMGPAIISMGLGLLAIAAGAPDAGIALIGGSQQFAMANFVQFTQAQESQADQAAVTFMEGSGQSSEGLLSFAERNFRYNEMLSASRIPPWMRTHPLWSDRIQALRARVEGATHKNVKDSPKEIEQLKLIQAKLFGYIEHPARTAQKYPARDQSAAARYARAVAAMRIGDLTRAREQADSLAGEFPRDPYYQELLGEIYIGNGRPAESVPYHRHALALSPQNALLQVNLGRALVATEDDSKLDEALNLLHTAVRAEPDNATAWNEIAQAYSRKGDDGQAKLATAELRFAVGDWPGARSFAERAKQSLAQNTPAWRRAADIAVIAETRTRQGRG